MNFLWLTRDAIEVHNTLGPTISLAIHFGTFALGDDGEREPVAELRESLENKDQTDSPFWVLEHGEGRDVPWPRGDTG